MCRFDTIYSLSSGEYCSFVHCHTPIAHNIREVNVRRGRVSKHKSAKKFRRDVSRSKLPNLVAPMRGGYRL